MIELETLLQYKIIPAIISAIVAILLFAFTQWLQARRTSIALLTSKLEELYLLVNELGTSNPVRYEKIRIIVNGDQSYLEDPEHIHKLLLADLDRKVKMYVHLYFPDLIESYIKLSVSHKPISTLINKLLSGIDIDQDEFSNAIVHYDSHIRSFEKEIIVNRQRLIGEKKWFCRYKSYKVKDSDSN